MKKIFSLLLILLLILGLIGCEKAPVKDNTPSSSETHLVDNSSVVSAPSTSSKVKEEAPKEGLAERLKKELEDGYNSEALLPENSTTLGMVELADKYAKKWADTADEYYKKIMEYNGSVTKTENYQDAEGLHSYLSTLKTTWENKIRTDCENELQRLKDTYGGGTIIGPSFAIFKLQKQKEWALEVVKIYESL